MSTAMRWFSHPAALVETDRIGDGTRIWAFAHVMPGAVLGAGCNVGDHCFVESGVVIGDHCTIKNGVSIWQHVHLGNDVFVGPNAVFTNDLYPRNPATSFQAVETHVEDGVTIGANATIVCGVRLGRRCFIGSGAVITRDVPAHALVTGNPARRRGWVCECGRRLRAAASGATACSHCGLRWTVGASGVTAA